MRSKKSSGTVKYPEAFNKELLEPVDAFVAADCLELGLITDKRGFCCPGTDCETQLTLAVGTRREPYLTSANRKHAEHCEFAELAGPRHRRSGSGRDPQIDPQLPVDFYPSKAARAIKAAGSGAEGASSAARAESGKSTVERPATRAPRKYGVAALVAGCYAAWCDGLLGEQSVRVRGAGDPCQQRLKDLFIQLRGQTQESLAGREHIFCGAAGIRRFKEGFRVELKGRLTFQGAEQRVSIFVDADSLRRGDTPKGLMRKKLEKLADAGAPIYAFAFGEAAAPTNPKFINIKYDRDLSRLVLWSEKTFNAAHFLEELRTGQKFLF